MKKNGVLNQGFGEAEKAVWQKRTSKKKESIKSKGNERKLESNLERWRRKINIRMWKKKRERERERKKKKEKHQTVEVRR